MSAAEKLAREAMTLPSSDRAKLAHRLIASLDDEDAEVAEAADTAGKAEALRRKDELDRGEVQPISHDELFRRVRRRLAG